MIGAPGWEAPTRRETLPTLRAPLRRRPQRPDSGGWRRSILGVPWRGSAQACLARGDLPVKHSAASAGAEKAEPSETPRHTYGGTPATACPIPGSPLSGPAARCGAEAPAGKPFQSASRAAGDRSFRSAAAVDAQSSRLMTSHADCRWR